jgi:hypothetical protein
VGSDGTARARARRVPQRFRSVPIALGVLTLASVGLLLTWDIVPSLFPPRAHDVLGALPLALIAVAYLAYQAVHKLRRNDLWKALLLTLAFLFWAANQLWPDLPAATVFNDVAIALFVLDVFWVLVQPGGYASDPISMESSPDHSTSEGTRLPTSRSVSLKKP